MRYQDIYYNKHTSCTITFQVIALNLQNDNKNKDIATVLLHPDNAGLF